MCCGWATETLDNGDHVSNVSPPSESWYQNFSDIQGFRNYVFFSFFQQIMCYFLASYAPKIPNYAQIPCISQGMKK